MLFQVVTEILKDALESLFGFGFFFLRLCNSKEMHRYFLESFLLELFSFQKVFLFIVYDTRELMLISGLQVLLQ